jgi:hypothetical protein
MPTPFLPPNPYNLIPTPFVQAEGWTEGSRRSVVRRDASLTPPGGSVQSGMDPFKLDDDQPHPNPSQTNRASKLDVTDAFGRL